MPGPDRWLSDYDNATAKADEAQSYINERDRLARGGQPGSQQVASKVRKALNELAMEIQRLEDELNVDGRQYHVTDAELSRRQNLVSSLKGRKGDLQSRLNKSNESRQQDDFSRNQLFGGGNEDRRLRIEDDRTLGHDQNDILQQQSHIMREQDKGIDMLAATIKRQKMIGLQIGGEVEEQNEMLDSLSDALDTTQRRLINETHHTVRVSEKAKSGGMLCCICLLILAIILVGAIPF